MGPGELAAPTDEDMLLYSGRVDGYVPVQTGVTEDEGDDHVSIISDGQYIYRRRNGSAANIYHYTLADYFFDATLAPAERDGKWVYLGTMGEEVTPVCYDSVYYTNTSGDGSFLFRRAATAAERLYPREPQRKIRPAGSRRGRICPLYV